MNSGHSIGLVGLMAAACAGAAPEIRMPLGKDSLAVKIQCQPAEAEVFLDGALQGTCASFAHPDARIRVGAGRHTVEVTARGFVPYRGIVEGAGMTAGLTVKLRAAMAAGGD